MRTPLTKKTSIYALFLCLFFSAFFVHALESSAKKVTSEKVQISITDAWARPTSPGQAVGAAYMTFVSPQNATLARIESDVSNSVEIHNMSMENGVMKMRMLEALPLKAGKPYALTLGGFHLMLFDLKKPLLEGDAVNFVFYFKAKTTQTKTKKSKTINFKQSFKVMVQMPPETPKP
jgi:copper(I)-binding protein